MTDIEIMIEEIKKFQSKLRIEEIDSHLVFMCHPDTKKLIKTAFIENKITINREFVHIYESKYYTPGDVYNVTDRKLKREILKQHGVQLEGEEYTVYTTYYSYDPNINATTITYNYQTSSSTNNGSSLFF